MARPRKSVSLKKLTLNGNLPVDVIVINSISKTDWRGKKNAVVELSGSRYDKVKPDGSPLFKTVSVSNVGVDTSDHKHRLSKRAGLVAHEDCRPCFVNSQASLDDKGDAYLRKISDLKVRVGHVKAKKLNSVDKENWLREAA